MVFHYIWLTFWQGMLVCTHGLQTLKAVLFHQYYEHCTSVLNYCQEVRWGEVIYVLPVTRGWQKYYIMDLLLKQHIRALNINALTYIDICSWMEENSSHWQQ